MNQPLICTKHTVKVGVWSVRVFVMTWCYQHLDLNDSFLFLGLDES